tara:strand:+ start:37028 stop:37906 length:879 start_codon:yes stop_codon:yes gene_type:complete
MSDTLDASIGCLQPGMEVGSFTVMECLGVGALGESYSAVGPSGTEDTVVHLLSPQKIPSDQMMLRLDGLLERGNGIQNSHVLEFVGAETDEFFNWVAFRKSDLFSLNAMIEARREGGFGMFGEKEVRRIIFQVLLALCVLHKRGIVHGSIKPAHCFVDEDLRLEISDAGLYPLIEFPSHYGPPDEGALSNDIPGFSPQVSSVIESTIFNAPECAERPEFTVESDLYSVGFLTWYLFSGHKRAGANFFYELSEEIRSEWGAWFLRATEPLPENRFHSAEEMLSEMPGVEIVAE